MAWHMSSVGDVRKEGYVPAQASERAFLTDAWFEAYFADEFAPAVARNSCVFGLEPFPTEPASPTLTTRAGCCARAFASLASPFGPPLRPNAIHDLFRMTTLAAPLSSTIPGQRTRFGIRANLAPRLAARRPNGRQFEADRAIGRSTRSPSLTGALPARRQRCGSWLFR